MCIGIILYTIYSSIGRYISYNVGTATPSPSAGYARLYRRANIYYSAQELFIVDW
nr:MAG TPA: hypothetical protein [Caudoviricetes sp.]